MKFIERKTIYNLLRTYIKYENKAFRVFTVIGFLLFLRRMLKLAYQLLPLKILRPKLIKKYGECSWALVTGATDGIGKGFCHILAKEGFSICMVGRNHQKLLKVKNEIHEKYQNIFVHVIVADFSESFEPYFFQKIRNDIEGLDISILVNNVGVDMTEYFTEIKEKKLKEIFAINCVPMVLLTHYVLQRMVQRTKRSAIINLSSAGGVLAYPYLSVYSSTKGFNDLFSRTLSLDYQKKVDVLSLRPFIVSTPMTFFRKTLDSITPEQCAEGALGKLGFTDYTYGHWKHTIQGFFLELLSHNFQLMCLKVLGPYMVKKERERQIRMQRNPQNYEIV